MAVADTVLVRVVGRFQSQNIVNTFHYEVESQASEQKNLLQNLAILWDTVNGAAWLARMSDAYDLIGTKAFMADGDSVPPGIAPINLSGDVAGDPQESYVCRVVTLYTGNPNHRVRGRVMMSGGAESMFDDTDGSVTDAEVTALGALATLFATDLTGGGDTFTPALYSKAQQRTEPVLKAAARKTPALIRSRRVRQFLIG